MQRGRRLCPRPPVSGMEKRLQEGRSKGWQKVFASWVICSNGESLEARALLGCDFSARCVRSNKSNLGTGAALRFGKIGSPSQALRERTSPDNPPDAGYYFDSVRRVSSQRQNQLGNPRNLIPWPKFPQRLAVVDTKSGFSRLFRNRRAVV